jgi:NitT/TauT family transport system ATP-binding protein
VTTPEITGGMAEGARTAPSAVPSAPSHRSTPSAPPEALASVLLRGVSKVYGNGGQRVHALDNIDLDVRPGEFVCLVGASGCGKSTLLNLVAGLDTPTAGTLDVRGRAALMFQEAALFPWLSVQGNIELALRLRGVKKAERREQAQSLLRTVQLEEFGDRLPHQLSGGMRQRVSLARAFAQDADVLLMDEPFGALDAMTRDILHHELEALWSDRNLTVVFVTHNVREAVRLGDRVVVLTSRPGRVAATFDVPFDRPRRIEAPDTSSLAGEITDRLKAEVRRHAGDDARA